MTHEERYAICTCEEQPQFIPYPEHEPCEECVTSVSVNYLMERLAAVEREALERAAERVEAVQSEYLRGEDCYAAMPLGEDYAAAIRGLKDAT